AAGIAPAIPSTKASGAKTLKTVSRSRMSMPRAYTFTSWLAAYRSASSAGLGVAIGPRHCFHSVTDLDPSGLGITGSLAAASEPAIRALSRRAQEEQDGLSSGTTRGASGDGFRCPDRDRSRGRSRRGRRRLRKCATPPLRDRVPHAEQRQRG